MKEQSNRDDAVLNRILDQLVKYFDGSVAVPWEEIVSISSSEPLNLTLKDGQAWRKT